MLHPLLMFSYFHGHYRMNRDNNGHLKIDFSNSWPSNIQIRFLIPLTLSQSDYLIQCWYKFAYLMANSADPDQLASSEANRSGSTLFSKAGHSSGGQGLSCLMIKSAFYWLVACVLTRLGCRQTGQSMCNLHNMSVDNFGSQHSQALVAWCY